MMIGIAVLSFLLTRGQVADSDGYFLAGRSLTGLVIAGSLLLTNISAEQIIGLAGSAYAFNLSSMAWEIMAVLAIAIMAIVLLPRYLAMNFKTLPSFLRSKIQHPRPTTDRDVIFIGLWTDHYSLNRPQR